MSRKRASSSRIFAVASIVFYLGMGGCAAGLLSRVAPQSESPSQGQLPKELEKFEVKDTVGIATPTPSPTPTAKLVSSESPKAHLKKKKAKIPTPQPAPTANVVSAPPSFKYVSRRPEKEPIWVGEQQVYDVSYFGMAAGTVTLEVLPYKAINNRKVYHVKGHAVTSKVFNIFYQVDDWVETFIDYEGIFSHRFHIKLDETKQIRDSLEINDSEKAETFYWNKWNRKAKGYVEIKEYKPIQPFSQDTLSALFYIRTLPLKDGDVYSFPVVSEGKTWEALVTVLGREKMKTPMGKISVIKLQPEHKFQGYLKKTGDSFIWLTDDDRRLLVRMDAKVRIGTVVTELIAFKPGVAPQDREPAGSMSTLQKINNEAPR